MLEEGCLEQWQVGQWWVCVLKELLSFSWVEGLEYILFSYI